MPPWGSGALMRAHTRAGFAGEMARPIRPKRFGGQPVVQVGIREARPRVATVHGLPHAPVPGGVDERPGLPLGPPHAGVELPGVLRVHDQVHRPHRVRHEEDLLPGVAAVPGAVDAPLLVLAEGVAQGRDEGHVGIPGIHLDPRR